jgi:hypothetical protein
MILLSNVCGTVEGEDTSILSLCLDTNLWQTFEVLTVLF